MHNSQCTIELTAAVSVGFAGNIIPPQAAPLIINYPLSIINSADHEARIEPPAASLPNGKDAAFETPLPFGHLPFQGRQVLV